MSSSASAPFLISLLHMSLHRNHHLAVHDCEVTYWTKETFFLWVFWSYYVLQTWALVWDFRLHCTGFPPISINLIYCMCICGNSFQCDYVSCWVQQVSVLRPLMFKSGLLIMHYNCASIETDLYLVTYITCDECALVIADIYNLHTWIIFVLFFLEIMAVAVYLVISKLFELFVY